MTKERNWWCQQEQDVKWRDSDKVSKTKVSGRSRGWSKENKYLCRGANINLISQGEGPVGEIKTLIVR